MHAITLTTDFGNASPYVAAMKGVILSINPAAAIHDLTHAIPAQDIRHAAQFLAGGVPYFPPGTIHVCVVDPGVGSERAILLVEVAGQFLLAPDNGCVTDLLAVAGGNPVVRVIEEPRFWRPIISSTFHGRDVFAPVAAHLSLGVAPAEMGDITAHWVKLPTPEVRKGVNQFTGEVMFIDDFGNLITNIQADALSEKAGALMVGKQWRKRIAVVNAYAEAAPGDVVALSSSDGRLEIAVVQGSAAKVLSASVGTPVTVGFPR